MSQSQEKSRTGEKQVSPGRNAQNEIDSDEERRLTKWLDDYFAASNSDENIIWNEQSSREKEPANNSSDREKTNEDNRKNNQQSCSSTNRLAESAADSNSASQKPISIASSTSIYPSQVCSQKKSPKNPKPSIRLDPEVIYISSDDE